VRFFLTADPVKELAEPRQLDLALDLTADEAAALEQKKDRLVVGLPTAETPNRRVWFLAVNHRVSVLANAHVRRALAHAINREKLLDDCFRGALQRRVHKAINGPYPAGSWACNPAPALRKEDKNSLDPHDPDLAASQKQ